ncbi:MULTISPECIES: flagellar hook assembly protein FlgD [Pseudomonas]|uniref:Basal-body rod modification protein FlgD n=1 Tax=Pseudomonas oryzihabitans TaxID=47885 RepID=A0A0U4WRU8_9PSED|nr:MULTISPECIES: flagellar hook assembly protein FlgD [Pseudomonas]ALZ85459.1 flagellar biosynthesis protein FlgD [Pseudomonas oryzihabitans]WCE10357.1 flagellar hook assembly protein FlgD [Pseudomonas sp. JBR1]HAC67673.1 flagellar hook assembly protein FlgD [Pseudomonas sp.]
MAISTTNSTAQSVLDKYSINKTGTTAETTASDGKKGGKLGKDEFLKLMVAQMNNQNPLEPQGNGEFIAQLAQFSTVEGITNLNTSVGSILSGSQSSQALQASTLVGRKVIVDSDKVKVDTSEDFKGALNLTASSPNVWVNVYDTTGNQVNRLNLGQQTSGLVNFTWDGTDASGKKLDAGTYRFEAQASVDGKTEAMKTSLPANVDSVTLGQNGGEMTLNLAGVGSIGISKVQAVGQ